MSADAPTSARDARPRSINSELTDCGEVSDCPSDPVRTLPEPGGVLIEQGLIETELLAQFRELLRGRRVAQDLDCRVSRKRLGREEDQDGDAEAAREG